MKILMIVAAHKPYRMPQDAMYLPLHVGRAGREGIGFAGDDTGVCISEKNETYCELTGLYWAWKNTQSDYLGLVHYRRHFAARRSMRPDWGNVIGEDALRALLEKTDIVLPAPRRYVIETNYSQYAHAHHAADLDTTREILCERWPQYAKAYDAVMKRTGGHRFNMFVMKRELADRYCAWLFDVLSELERRLDISAYSRNDRRVFGFVGERLLDVWLEANGLAWANQPVMFMEKQNWLKKGGAFISRKLRAGLRKKS